MKYFQEGVSNWKKVFNDWDGGVYGSLVLGSRTWLEDEDSVIDGDGGWWLEEEKPLQLVENVRR
jgi:hypothetical protein